MTQQDKAKYIIVTNIATKCLHSYYSQSLTGKTDEMLDGMMAQYNKAHPELHAEKVTDPLIESILARADKNQLVQRNRIGTLINTAAEIQESINCLNEELRDLTEELKAENKDDAK